jgi:2-polyprenyl-3-methyl-5-hydroxy-6-metoxy-1,4-benzoquinol methylase
LYSKDYYEPANENAISAISKTTRTVLSIGCGWGATERRLVEQGLRVAAVPLDRVISTGAAARGVEMIYGDIDEIATLTRGQKFDCVLCLNILHLASEPAAVLRELRDCLSDDSVVIIQVPNMMSLRAIRSAFRDISIIPFSGHASTGVHFSSLRRVESWCSRSGMKVDQTVGLFAHPEDGVLGRIWAVIGDFVPSSLAMLFATSIVISARRLRDEHAEPGRAAAIAKTKPDAMRRAKSGWRNAPRA